MANYYFDATLGNDSTGDGSIENPWQTVTQARIQIVAGVSAGDQFLFKCGETFVPTIWGTNWALPYWNNDSGNSGAYCTFGSYGEGAKPIIDMRYTVASAWTDDGSNHWHSTLAVAFADVRRMFLDGVESAKAANSGAINGTDHLWFYDTGTGILYVYSVGTPAGKVVIVPEAGGMSMTQSSYWKFENIVFNGCGYYLFDLGSTACTYLEWNDCEFNYSGQPSIIVWNNLGADGHHHLTFDGCTFDGKGALISKAVTEAELGATWGSNHVQFDKSVNDVHFTDCVFRDGFHSQINVNNTSDPTGNGTNRFLIEHCDFYGTNSPYVRPFQFSGVANKCDDNVVRYCWFEDVTVRAQIGGTDGRYYYNIWNGVRDQEETGSTRSNAICLYSVSGTVCVNNLIDNNVFYNVDMEGVWINHQASDTTTGNQVRNNILWNCGQRSGDASPYLVGAAITVDSDISDTNHFHNNCIYNSGGTDVITHGGTQYTVAEAQAALATIYSGNVQSDPLCTSTSNFTLQSGSPARNAGMDVDLTTDYAGNPVGLVPDIGAYEYAVVAPTVTTTAESSVSWTTATSGGNVTDGGDATVTGRGVCWAVTENPTTANSKTEDSSGTGAFASSITGLSAGTTYHVRAYAINSAGTSYGADNPLTTKSAPAITSLSDTTILAGQSIVITGTNFGASEGNSVKFNGTNGTVTAWADTEITVTAPASLSAGNVVVYATATVYSSGSAYTMQGGAGGGNVGMLDPSMGWCL